MKLGGAKAIDKLLKWKFFPPPKSLVDCPIQNIANTLYLHALYKVTYIDIQAKISNNGMLANLIVESCFDFLKYEKKYLVF